MTMLNSGFKGLTAGYDYICCFFIFFISTVLNMLLIKRDINQQDCKIVDIHFAKSE